MDDWRRAARQQAGVVSRAQALASGLTSRQVGWLVSSGRWVRMLPGVYATFTGPQPPITRVWAALLHAGERAVAGGATSLWLDKVIDTPPRVVTVCVPEPRRVAAQPGLVVVRRRGLESLAHPAAVPPRLRVEEAVLDVTAAATRPRDAITPVLKATQRRITTAARIGDRLAVRRAHPWRRLLTGVLSEVVEGVTSMLEREYLYTVERPHGLPRGTRQVRTADPRRRRYRDIRYRRWRLVVELDGKEAHLDEERFRDKQRDNGIVLAHDSPLQYGWVDVADDPCGVAAQVAQALADRGWTGRPTSCGPGCALSRG